MQSLPYKFIGTQCRIKNYVSDTLKYPIPKFPQPIKSSSNTPSSQPSEQDLLDTT